MKGWKNDIPYKQSAEEIMSEKIDLKTWNVNGNKDGLHMMERSIYQEGIINTTEYILNIRVSKHMKQKL